MSVGLFAQMTDDQIIDYVKSGVGSGKDEQQSFLQGVCRLHRWNA